MYCRDCGTQLPDDSRFCSKCGAPQNGGGGRKKFPLVLILSVAVCVLLVFSLVGRTPKEESTAKDSPVTVSQPVRETEAPKQTLPPETEAKPQIPENGWYEEGGKRYYYSDGEPLTGLQEINDDLYYFNADGTLAVNTTVEYSDNSLEAGRDGRLTAVTFAFIDGEWSSDKYRFGNNGTSSIKILDMEVTNCQRTGFYLEANGLRGAKVNCNWKIYVRSHGSWVFAKEIYFTEPSGTFEIRFDRPMDFDAITAYPTVQGNASYSSYFALVDVHMGL